MIIVDVHLEREAHLAEVALHFTDCAWALARAKAGNSSAARIAMMAITTSNSISVKATTARKDRFVSSGFMIITRCMTQSHRSLIGPPAPFVRVGWLSLYQRRDHCSERANNWAV